MVAKHSLSLPENGSGVRNANRGSKGTVGALAVQVGDFAGVSPSRVGMQRVPVATDTTGIAVIRVTDLHAIRG